MDRLFMQRLLVAVFTAALSVTSSARAEAPAAAETIQSVGYALGKDAAPDSFKIKKLIALCADKKAPFKCDMPQLGAAAGALAIYEYPLPLNIMTGIMTTESKHQIFKSTIYAYHRNLSPAAMEVFLKNGKGVLRFASDHEVVCILKTRFAYTMDGELMHGSGFAFERETTRPGARRISGLGGHINSIKYYTILIALDAGHTRRIVANWSDAGGDIPVVGKIRATPKQINEGMDKGNEDIIEYFKLKGKIK